MKYKKYQHIEKIGRSEVEGLLDGKVYVQPKIDGTNSVVYLGDDGLIHAGSRKRDLTLDDDNAGFYNAIINDEKLKAYLNKHPNHYIYCEWLVKHSIGYYNPEAWRHYYIFDVFEVNNKNDLDENGEVRGRYIPFDEYKPLLEEFGLTYIPCLAVIENPTIDDLTRLLKENHYLIPEDKIGEGIVCKNYSYTNKYKHVVWGKIIAEEFFNVKGSLRIKNHLAKEAGIEEQIANEYITESVIRKEHAKIVNDNPDMTKGEEIGRTLNAVFDNFLKEDLLDVIKKYKRPTINFQKLKQVSDRLIKEALPELFK